MTFNDAELTALASQLVPIGVFFRLDVEPEPIRLWLGFGDIVPGVNVYDDAGAVYRGLGVLQNVPAINTLINGAAERVEFELSGVAGPLQEIASGNDAASVKSRPVALGFGIFGRDWALLGPIHWCAFYVADYLAGALTVDDMSGQLSSVITLSCGTRFTGRRRPSFSYFSDKDQQARFPGDKFCSLAPNYAHGFSKIFPVF